MTITLNGTTGITTPDIDSTAGFDGEDLTGDVAAARITGALNATGSAPIYACRAWVNFNGTGTVAIRASGNVSSITDNGTGDYTVNFSTAMPDANYATTLVGTAPVNVQHVMPAICDAIISGGALTYTTTQLRVVFFNPTASSSKSDPQVVCLSVFR